MDSTKPPSWYIPRPSLTTLTKNHHDALKRYHRDSEVIDIKKPPKRNSSSAKFSSSSSSTISSQHSKDQRQICMMETCIDGVECEIKRGSRSSQGSSDSEQSIHVRIFCIKLK
jgi:hypothetical protein